MNEIRIYKSTLSPDVPPFIPKSFKPESTHIAADSFRVPDSVSSPGYHSGSFNSLRHTDVFGWSSPFYIPSSLTGESVQQFHSPRSSGGRWQQNNNFKSYPSLEGFAKTSPLKSKLTHQPLKHESLMHKRDKDDKGEYDFSPLMKGSDQEVSNQCDKYENDKGIHAMKKYSKPSGHDPYLNKKPLSSDKGITSRENRFVADISTDINSKRKTEQKNRNQRKSTENWNENSSPFVHNSEEFPDLTSSRVGQSCINSIDTLFSVSPSDIYLPLTISYSDKLKSKPVENKINIPQTESHPADSSLEKRGKCSSKKKYIEEKKICPPNSPIKDSLNSPHSIVKNYPKRGVGEKNFCSPNIGKSKSKIQESSPKKNADCQLTVKIKQKQSVNINSHSPMNSRNDDNFKKNGNSASSSDVNYKEVIQRNTGITKSRCMNSNVGCKQNDGTQGGKNSNLALASGQSTVGPKAEKKARRKKKKIKKLPFALDGKITILTPEMHSLIIGQADKQPVSDKSGSVIDLSDPEEYPELGETSLSAANIDKPKKVSFESKMTYDGCKNEENIKSDYPTVEESRRINKEHSERLKLTSMQQSSIVNLYSDVLIPHKKHQQHSAKESLQSLAVGEKVKDSAKENIHDEGFQTTSSKKLIKPKKMDSSTDDKSINPSTELQMKKKNVEKGDSCGEGEKTKPKTHTPILLTMADVISSSQQKVKKQKEVRFKVISSKWCPRSKMPLGPHNILDSSAPVRKRGKEREKPRKKKQSVMKKTILKEREEKKKLRLQQSESSVQAEDAFSEVDSDVQSKSEPNMPITSDHESIGSSPVHGIQHTSTLQLFESLTLKSLAAKIVLHTRNFREYCDHLLSEEIDNIVKELLSDLIRFQDRLYQKDPVKASMRRRLVYGLKEVTKYLQLNKVKCILLAPDLERIQSKGGLDDALTTIIRLSEDHSVPCIFALQRRKLGRVCLKSVPVSCVGICSYSGSEEKFKVLVELHTESKKTYKELLRKVEQSITDDDAKKLLNASKSFSYGDIYQLRTTILRETFVNHAPSPTECSLAPVEKLENVTESEEDL